MEHGAPVIELLHTLPTHTAGGYARRLLQSVDDRAGAIVIPRQALRDPLSARELEVLRLLSTDLTGPDIARQLVVSVHTVRTHTKSIYAKLGVGSRRAAVSRAGPLGLLAHGR
jgi:LuxR family maltose regulon positive regulatory protein